MFSALLQRRSPSPCRSGFVPPLASPFEIALKEGPSSVRHTFPPRRPLRHQRRQELAIQMPPTIMTSPPTSPSYHHGTPSSLPRTPINKCLIPSSPPGAPLRCRVEYPSRFTDDGESSSTCVPDKIDLLLSESSVGGGSDAGGSAASSIGSLLDAAFRRSADRVHAEFLNLRNLCTKIILTGKSGPCEQMGGVNLDLLVPGEVFDDLDDDDDDDEPFHDAPMESEDCNSASPATTYYSLSPSSSPIRYDIDLPSELAASSRPSPLPLSPHPRLESSSSPPRLFLSLPDPFTNVHTFEPPRTRKRKRTDSSVLPRVSPVAKRQRLRTTTSLSLFTEEAEEEAEVEAELLELQPQESVDFDITYNRAQGRPLRASTDWLLTQNRVHPPPIRLVDSVFLD